MPVEIVDVDVVHDGWGKFLVATIRLADGEVVRREIEDHGNAVAVLPYDPMRRTALLVRQFRAPLFYAAGIDTTVEAIAGGREDDDPETGVRREAMEEAGVRLGALEHVLTGLSMPGVSTMQLDLYLAPYARGDRVGGGGGLDTEHERITVVELPLGELAREVDAGGLFDLATGFLVQTLRLRHPDLFASGA